MRMDLTRVAVVEDDPEFREAVLLPLLRQSGFAAEGFGSALELYRALVSERYDLVLLDVGLPDSDGLEIARHLRETLPAVGIVILSGRMSPADRMHGLGAGVDAYLGKPVRLQELVATLRNVAQRIRQTGQEAAEVERDQVVDQTVDAGGWRLDARGWNIVAPCGSMVVLNLAEREVMAQLVASPGVPVSREALIERLVDDVREFDPHRLEMLVYRLRKKCLQKTRSALPLQTVRGVGYMLAW